jgi:hypothetical protein
LKDRNFLKLAQLFMTDDKIKKNIVDYGIPASPESPVNPVIPWLL